MYYFTFDLIQGWERVSLNLRYITEPLPDGLDFYQYPWACDTKWNHRWCFLFIAAHLLIVFLLFHGHWCNSVAAAQVLCYCFRYVNYRHTCCQRGTLLDPVFLHQCCCIILLRKSKTLFLFTLWFSDWTM